MFKTPCNHKIEENRARCNAIRNKVVGRAMRIEAEKEVEAFSKSTNKIFKFLKKMKKEISKAENAFETLIKD